MYAVHRLRMMGEAVVLLPSDLVIARVWADSWALTPLVRSVENEAFPCGY